MVHSGVCRRVRPWFGLWLLQGASPFGIVEAIWALLALRRWSLSRNVETGV